DYASLLSQHGQQGALDKLSGQFPDGLMRSAVSELQAKLRQADEANRGKPVSSADFDYNFQAINDQYPGMTPGTFKVRAGDTLQSVALAVWGDSSLWYIIADANGLAAGATLIAGQELVIPNVVSNIHDNASTFRVYDPGQLIGDTTPKLPDPPPPPPQKHGACGGFGAALVAIVAVAV